MYTYYTHICYMYIHTPGTTCVAFLFLRGLLRPSGVRCSPQRVFPHEEYTRVRTYESNERTHARYRCTYVCIYIYIYIYICKSICISMCIYIYICMMCIYIYIEREREICLGICVHIYRER